MGFRIRTSLFFSIFLLSLPLSSQSLLLDSRFQKSNLIGYVERYEDGHASLKPADLSNKELVFQKVSKVNLGYSDSAHWLRFNVKNAEKNSKLVLYELAYPLIDSIEVFVKNLDTGEVQTLSSGDRVPFGTREIRHQNFIFPVRLAPQTEYRFLVRILTESSVQFPMTLWSANEFSNHIVDEQKTFGLYYGIMIAMMAYNFFLFIGTRDRSYLFYVLFLTGYVLFQACLNGLAFQYLWPDSIWWANSSLPFFMFFGGGWGAQFSREFLRMKSYHPLLDRILLSYFFLGMISSVLSLGLNFSIGIKLAIAYVFFMVVLLISSGLVSIFKGYRAARFYLSAWIFLLLGIVTYILKTLTLFPSNFVTEYSIQFGSSFEVLLLSLALADRINILKKEKEEAQKKLIESQKEALKKQTVMTQSFERFVPKQFLNHLGKDDISDIRLGDQARKEMTIFFSDIRHFTKLSEKMDPKDNFNFLNSYLKRMNPLVIQNGGFVDKFIGDAIMALFPESGEDALRAAIEMQSEVRLYNHHRLKTGYEPIKIGIGIHTGHLMLGTIGTEERMEGTVISDTVNLASRIEGLTKKFDSSILISEKTLQTIPDPTRYKMRLIGRAKVKGKEDEIVIFDVYEGLSQFQIDLRNDTKYEFEKGVTNFLLKQFDRAQDSFASVLKIDPTDYAAEIYLKALRKTSTLRKT
ncbi:7TM diverse intracellular signaling domain-containing protein [Leptospira yasudae]|uniref:7TM diverse intracellular signaling domain-containing protein n=1 Tax=Leptospira yasudae TaxID=2202201 RepID=UPI0010916824|nr:7TM diverse intracellular signaling domain-containing protein [Leptospira yasudae]MBW0435716.1 adenylate/guanylate cyclase [Leptospira yasudae]TGM96547.1 adenylate/guanylate cyclase [Leptospira yasudae]